jgi:hypothetical protein
VNKLFLLQRFPVLNGIAFGLGILFFTLWEVKFITNADPANHGFILGSIPSLIIIIVSGISIIPVLSKDSNTLVVNRFSTALIFCSFIFLLTNWSYTNFGFLPDSHIALSAIIISLVLFFIGIRLKSEDKTWSFFLVLTSAIFIASFLLFNKFNPLFTDDHGPVLYRLQLLKDNFPNIPVYNTDWNAGYDWRDFFATGILNVFAIFSPLIYSLPITTAYALIIPLTLFLILPLASYLGARVLTVNKTGASISALLALTSSSLWYKWGLSYGSMGFVCSTALISLTYATLLSILHKSDKLTWKNVILTICLVSLTISWTAQGITLIPLLLLAATKFKLLFTNRKILVIALGTILINSPWIIAFLKVSKVTSFVQPSGEKASTIMGMRVGDKIENVEPAIIRAKKGKLSIKECLKRLREFGSKLNPILLILFIPALFINRIPKYYLNNLVLTSLFLTVVGIIGPSFKPQLELERLLIVMSLLICMPVGSYLASLIETPERSYSRLQSFCLITLFLTGILSTFNFIQNKGFYTYTAWPKDLESISSIIKDNHLSGRTLFTGFVLHELGGGHIAPLSYLSGSPIVASSPVHNLWWYTDVIPEEFRVKSIPGIEEYLDLMNVSLVVAHERNWKKVLRDNPIKYKEIGIVDEFVFFRREPFPNSYFISGEGEVLEQTNHNLKLKLNSTFATLKFTYFPFLQAKGCKDISAHEIGSSIKFIKLDNCEKGEVVINSIPIYKRVLQ